LGTTYGCNWFRADLGATLLEIECKVICGIRRAIMANCDVRGFLRVGIGVAVLVVAVATLGSAAAGHGAAIDKILGVLAVLVLAAACFFSGLGWVLTRFARD
jgi:hypothetical protein